MTGLESEVSTGRLEISAESLSMSISELTNLYREGVLRIQPEFQRLYRWTNEQKSRLIESVLLGIPLPSLFVAQTEDGGWELVDGLQRVSTLLELQGVLLDARGNVAPPLVLTSTKFLPSLEGRSWSGPQELSEALKLDIRLARLDLRVIKRSSDPNAKFDLFQRLNSYGSTLTPQEIRSAMIAGTRSECLSWLVSLTTHPGYAETVLVSDRLKDEQYDLELVLRFLMLHDRDPQAGGSRRDFSSRLDDWALALATEFDARSPGLEDTFKATFDHIAAHGGEDVFRKWDPGRRAFRGSFSNTAFEVVGLGAGYLTANGLPVRKDLLAAAQSLWELLETTPRFTTGLGTYERLGKTIPLGRKLMADPPLPVSPADL